MKPGDHPEFFRLPPPPGQSRESTIVLDRYGRFHHEGAPVEHPGLARAFASWIATHPDDGRYILQNGYDWCYFTVEDTPLFVSGVRRDGDAVVLELFDGSSERLDPTALASGSALASDDDGVLRARVRGGRHEARFGREAMLMIAPLLADGDDGAPELEVGGRRYPIAPRAPLTGR
jgi:hypothetical protein